MQFLRKIFGKMKTAKTLDDAALGCIIGACAGDAAGAPLEMLGRKPNEEEVERALTMPGGGKLKVAPGQITDDGELTLCLAQGLAECGSLQLEPVARRYADWVRSRPFDMGFTIRRSLACFHEDFAFFDEGPRWRSLCQEQGYSVAMSKAASEFNSGSKANGSLMRVSPLGVFGRSCRTDELARFAQAEAALSHPNETCLHAASCYVIAIASLMNHPGDRRKASGQTRSWAEKHANDEVNQWLADARSGRQIPCHPHAGFVRIPFTLAFRHLEAGSNYIEALRQTLAGGGDTDTNACIVGGLVGAACGASAIPEEMKTAVLDCDTKAGAHRRPDFLHPKQIPELVRCIVNGCWL